MAHMNTDLGFPGTCNDILPLNFCILYAKYYIYNQKLSNSNKIDFLNFLTYLIQEMNIEKNAQLREGMKVLRASPFCWVIIFDGLNTFALYIYM